TSGSVCFQHHIRQIKRLVAQRVSPSVAEQKLSTLDTLEKTVELLKGTPIYPVDSSNVSSPGHSWSSIPTDSTTNSSEDNFCMPSSDFADRHLFSVKLSLPDGRISEYRNNSQNSASNQLSIKVGECFFDIISEQTKQALLANVFTKAKRRRILTRISGTPGQACELLCEFKRSTGSFPVLQIHALQLQSAFQPAATIRPFTFCTRHSGSCILTYFDPSAAPYLGYLPEDVSKHSILYLIHPYDAVQMKQIHAELVLQRGGIVRQQCLRWIAYNGSIVHSTTEWSAFWNPWSRKLDVIVGRHTISEHPIGSANVLLEADDQRIVSPLNQTTVKALECEILAVVYKYAAISVQQESYLNATLLRKTDLASDSLDKKNLGTYIDNLVETLVVNAGNQATKCFSAATENVQNLSSPTDISNTNSLPLLSYSQINCLENVHRLLKSQSKIDLSSGMSSPVKDSDDADCSLPIPNEENNSGAEPDTTVRLPLTQEVLLQHTRFWEQEYKDTWRRRLNLKRCIQQQNRNSYTVAQKLFKDCHNNCIPSQAFNNILSSNSRNEWWNCKNKDDYYRSLGPNPTPPPGLNFQVRSLELCFCSITSMPLPPSILTDEHRSVDASQQTTSSEAKTKSLCELPQPINLCINDPCTTLPSSVKPDFDRSDDKAQYQQRLPSNALSITTSNQPLMIPLNGTFLSATDTSEWSASRLSFDNNSDACTSRLLTTFAQQHQHHSQLQMQH
uniref:PAS domain-containing protein n=1 Tax=Syphacia muris TaxID=451379 RepID=A0A0N5AUG5_9BILA